MTASRGNDKKFAGRSSHTRRIAFISRFSYYYFYHVIILAVSILRNVDNCVAKKSTVEGIKKKPTR